MFERNYRVERFDTGRGRKLKVPTLMHYLNDIMERNAESYGLGAQYHLERDLAWVLVEYQITIDRWPKADENVVVGTIPYSFKRIYGYRKYRVKDSTGNRLVEGKGKFALINIKTKEFIRPPRELLDRFTDAKKEPEALPFDKWDLGEEKLVWEKQTYVAHSHIDVNGHMNNAYYPQLAYEALPKRAVDEVTISEVFVRYRREVFYGESLILKVSQVDNGFYVGIYTDEVLASEVYFRTEDE